NVPPPTSQRLNATSIRHSRRRHPAERAPATPCQRSLPRSADAQYPRLAVEQDYHHGASPLPGAENEVDMLMDLGDHAADFRSLIGDRAGQFAASSGAVLASTGIEAVKIPPRSPRANGPAGLLSCSFCGKHQKQIKKLIAGPGACICNECIHRVHAVL